MNTDRLLRALNQIMSDRFGVTIEYEVKPCGISATTQGSATQETKRAAV